MSFVGIISSSDNYDFIQNEIKNKKEFKNLKLINLNQKNIENMRNIKFETLVFDTDMKKMNEVKDIIYNILKNAKYLIINSDLYSLKETINNDLQIITYGMGQKATVTASSIKDDEIMICLQRNIENINGNIIEMQESKVKDSHISNDRIYDLLVIFVLKNLYS